MRAVKNTSLGFGLVNVPVKLYKATEDHSVGFHQHHGGDCHGAVGRQALCKECGEVVAYGDIVKGIDRDGETVIVTPEDLATLERDTSSGIELLQVVSAEQIDPSISAGAMYYLAPSDAKSLPGYALLRDTLGQRAGIVRYVMRETEHLAVLRVRGNMLILQNLVWHEDIRQPEFALLDKPVKLADKMVAAAAILLDSLAGDFNHAEHTDEYIARVRDLVDAKASGEVSAPVEIEAEAEVCDLLAALEASVAKRRHTVAA